MKVLFIASTGGHLKELLQLKSLFSSYQTTIVTEKTPTTKDLTVEGVSDIRYLVHGTKDHLLKYLFIFPWNILKSIYLFCKVRPAYVVTTGAHTAVPMCYIAKLFRRKVVYIETFANMHSKSLSGKLVYPIADLFLVQWESMLELYPKATYWGGVF